MKRIILAFSIAFATLITFNSCTKEYYDIVPSITVVYERAANEWRGTGNSKYIDLNVPELSNYYVDQGAVSVAISFDDERTYNTIPAVINGISYHYNYTLNSIRIFAQDPLLENVDININNKSVFKITLTESDFVE